MYRNNSPFYSVFILFHFVRVTYYFNCVFILLYPLLAFACVLFLKTLYAKNIYTTSSIYISDFGISTQSKFTSQRLKDNIVPIGGTTTFPDSDSSPVYLILSYICTFTTKCIRVKFRPLFWKVYKREFEGNKHFGNGNQPKRCKRPRFCIIFVKKLLAKLFYEDTISFHRLHVALTKSETIYCGVNILICVDFQHGIRRKRILVFGCSKAGKTSMLNTITGQKHAVRDAAVGTTFETKIFEDFKYNGKIYKFIDTAGLDEGNKGTTSSGTAISNLYKFIKNEEEKGFNLFIMVMKKSAISQAIERNYELFINHIKTKEIPCLCVVTGCEDCDCLNEITD
uniref:G domain-containing protein n=1 Tax=Heterorhabditis bacteriophora TaxID=37862 RepID=A0A1I7W933_HETBA